MSNEPIKPMSREDIEYYRQGVEYMVTGATVRRIIATIDERDKRIAELELERERFQLAALDNETAAKENEELLEQMRGPALRTELRPGQRVEVSHPRYHGPGILQRIDRPIPAIAWVTLEHGEERWYELNTVRADFEKGYTNAE
jgi:hypothetical protein